MIEQPKTHQELINLVEMFGSNHPKTMKSMIWKMGPEEANALIDFLNHHQLFCAQKNIEHIKAVLDQITPISIGEQNVH